MVTLTLVAKTRDSECPYHEALKVALIVPLGDTVSALMVEPPTQSSTDASDAPSNLTPKPSRASVWMSLTLVAPFSSLNRSFCWDSESHCSIFYVRSGINR